MGNHLHEKVLVRDSIEQDLWILPAPICRLCYINGNIFLLGYNGLYCDPVKHMRENNANATR